MVFPLLVGKVILLILLNAVRYLSPLVEILYLLGADGGYFSAFSFFLLCPRECELYFISIITTLHSLRYAVSS